MALDVELYRRMVFAPGGSGRPRRISVIDIAPEGATRTLVFAHGFGGRTLQWVNQLRFFGRVGQARVIAPDLRGHGLSDDPSGPITMDGLVDDLALVLSALGVTEDVALIAHSFGGALAVEFALRYPERVNSLTLAGTPSRFTLRPGVRRLMNIPDALFRAARDGLHLALYAPPHTLRRFHDAAMAPWHGDERMPALRVPTLVILGQRDNLFLRERYEDASRVIPGAQGVVIPVSAHLVQLERPDAVNRAIHRFLEAHPPASAPAAPSAPPVVTRALWRQYYDPDVPDYVPTPRQPLDAVLATSALAYPDRAALVFFGQRIGYGELDRLANRLAHALRTLGTQPGDRVAIILPNIPQCVIAFYGALRAGAVVVLGSPLSSEEEITHQLSDSGARVLLTLANYRAMCERIAERAGLTDVIYTDAREYLPLRRRLPLARVATDAIPAHAGYEKGENGARRGVSGLRSHSFQRLLRASPAAPLESGRGPDDLALVQYTSGTAEAPKGAMLTHANLLVNLSQVRHWLTDARRGREVTLCALPLSHSYGVTSCLNLSIALGATIALLPSSRAEEIMRAIKRERPTLLPGVPSLYLMIANYPDVRAYGVASIRACISGSAPLPVEVQEAFEKLTRGRLVEGYGLTEASPVTHCNPLKGERRAGSIGIPMPGTDAKIVSMETGAAVAPGEVGELLVRGPQVMRGYWNALEETAATFSDGWLRTGDLARMDEDGFFAIVERKKDLIISGAYNVYPREVEEVLYEHPKVLEAAVASAPDSAGAPAITAYVVLKRGERATAEEILALCRERLEAYKTPRAIEFRDELPKNFVGKILRRVLVGRP